MVVPSFYEMIGSHLLAHSKSHIPCFAKCRFTIMIQGPSQPGRIARILYVQYGGFFPGPVGEIHFIANYGHISNTHFLQYFFNLFPGRRSPFVFLI
jgi:hypothetical protein